MVSGLDKNASSDWIWEELVRGTVPDGEAANLEAKLTSKRVTSEYLGDNDKNVTQTAVRFLLEMPG